jgi:hypothetical protein
MCFVLSFASSFFINFHLFAVAGSNYCVGASWSAIISNTCEIDFTCFAIFVSNLFVLVEKLSLDYAEEIVRHF